MSQNASPLETETLHDTTTFDHFGRSWTVPTKRHLSHIKRMQAEVRAGVGNFDVLAAEVMLSPEQFAELLKLDPDEGQLADFASKISKAMGLGTPGN